MGGTFVSHATGAVTKFGMVIEGSYVIDIWYQPLVLVVAFILGSIMCGVVVVGNEVQFGKSPYGLVLLANSLLLIGATFLAEYDVAPYLAAVACGLQNGMCTMHFGAVVRTTHVTGLVTDVGLLIGRLLGVFFRARCRYSNLSILDRSQIEVDLSKLGVLTLLGIGFFVGVLLGTYLNRFIGIYAFLVPASITGTGGFLCAFFRQRMKKTLKSSTTSLNDKVMEIQRALQAATARIEDLRARHANKALEEDEIGDMCQYMDGVQATIGQLKEDVREMSPRLQLADISP